MSVCWDAEANGRAPCGALSTQDSSFLLIPRIIMRVPDVGLRGDAAGRLVRRGQPQPEVELQRDGSGADEASVAVAGPHVREVERAHLLTLPDGAGAGHGAVAHDLDPGADSLAGRPRDGGGEGDAAAGAEQPEGDGLGAARAQGADALHDERR